MNIFKKNVDLNVFNPVYGGDLENNKTITLKMSDFDDLVNAVEYSVIAEINKDKGTLSHEVVGNMLKYLDDEATEEDVIASLKEYKEKIKAE